jgi:CBS domain-containing membrane protein
MSYRFQPELRREDFISALRELDSFIDVTLEDLMQINEIAQKHARLRQAEEVLVQDIMTPEVAIVNRGGSLRSAAALLLEQRISGLPVVDDANKLVGIVTEADFLCAMGIPCHHPAHTMWQTLEWMFMHQPSPANTPGRVADIMTAKVVTVSASQSLHDAIDRMKRHHIKRLVVTDDQDQVVGIVTRSNLVKVLLQQVL